MTGFDSRHLFICGSVRSVIVVFEAVVEAVAAVAVFQGSSCRRAAAACQGSDAAAVCQNRRTMETATTIVR